jgi:beta-galactosidase
VNTRRSLLTWLLGAASAAGSPPGFARSEAASLPGPDGRADEQSLDGEWLFRTDPQSIGENDGWSGPGISTIDWTTVIVPHTWQVMRGYEEYRGVAWYRRSFDAPGDWATRAVRIEFEAVFHSATVWVNGRLAGQHRRKGYTAFKLELSPWLRAGARNDVVVKVNNAFEDAMLPSGRSSDWAHDGGIYRPVRLLITAPVFIDRIAIEATPRLRPDGSGQADRASIAVTVDVHNTTARSWHGHLRYRILERDTGRSVLQVLPQAALTLQPGEARRVAMPAVTFDSPQLWHFDRPHLYAMTAVLFGAGECVHEQQAAFGVRSVEVRGTSIYLNGEQVRLMGVERMAGSNPEYGMAEPSAWIAHDHGDLRNLNCVLSRAHWQQDRRVLDYCDQHGVLLQSEIPAWGWETFGAAAHPTEAILQSGLEQLREMIDRDRNHPCIISWGLCNEVGGQQPAAFEFAQRMYAEAKRLDPTRLCSYASNSLQWTPEKDVSGLMDFVECNEYFGSWTDGTPEDLRRSLLAIHRAFPDKPLVISEYGYCGCVPTMPESDTRRIEILQQHTRICRELDFVAGLIVFSYNDYRTHAGTTGSGATQQRTGGVVDLYGQRKPSYEVLRRESSPIEELQIAGLPTALTITLRTRSTIPSYRLLGYTLRGLLYGPGDTPIERRVIDVPALAPGEQATLALAFTERASQRIVVDVMKPTGVSACSATWRA